MSSNQSPKVEGNSNPNEPRLDRLDQLLRTIDKSQQDLSRLYTSHLDITNIQMGYSLDSYKQKIGVNTNAQLLEWIQRDMTTGQKDEFKQFLDFNARLQDPFPLEDNYVLVAALILGTAIDTRVNISAFAQTVAIFRIIRMYCMGFKTLVVGGNYHEAKEQLGNVRKAVKAALSDVRFDSRFAQLLGTIAHYDEFLGNIGQTVQNFVQSIGRITDHEKQKTAAIEGIHTLQIARLSSTYFLSDAPALAGTLAKLNQWITWAVADTPGVDILAEQISRELSSAPMDVPRYPTLFVAQESLREKDLAEGYYGYDDLADNEVVKGARNDF